MAHRRRQAVRVLIVLSVAAGMLSLAGWDLVPASNMAFKLNKIIHPLSLGGKGRNYTSFPDRGPHSGPGGLTQICTALNLDPNQGDITQIDPAAGTVNTYRCGQIETFTFMDEHGAIVTNPAATGGIIVGSDIPGNDFYFVALGSAPIGSNIHPVEYHTTAVTPEDLCNQCGFSSTAEITRFGALNGIVETHRCTQVPLWNLQLGEAVLIRLGPGDPPVTCTPPHF